MAMNKVFRLLVSKDVAVAASGLTPSTVPNGGVVAFKSDWTQLGASDDISDSSLIYVVQGVTSSDPKIGNIASFSIKGTGVTGYLGQKFQAGRYQISYVGAAPLVTYALGSGSIVATSGLEYEISIINKSEKEKYQVPERYNFLSDSSATQLEIATKAVAAINGNPDSCVVATVIGNGTGSDGLTGATAWGIKLKAKLVTTFFEVSGNDSWGATPFTTPITNFAGINTFDQLTVVEQYSQGYQGYLNRFILVKPITNFIVAQANSALTVTGTDTLVVTQDSTLLTFGSAVTSVLVAGDSIYISGVQYTIDTKTSSTVYHTTEPYKGSTATLTASTAVTKEESYDTIIVDHDAIFDRPFLDGHATRPEQTIIAIPSYLAQATALTTIETCLDSWMASTPGKFPGAGL